MEEQLQIRNRQGEILDARLHLPKAKATKAAILLHGFTGDKNLAWLHYIAHDLREKGIAALRIDLSGHGDSEGLFRDLGLKKGIADVESALEVMKERGYEEFALVGHSLGAAISLLLTPNHMEVKCVVEVAGPTRLGREENEDFVRKVYNQQGIEHGALLDDMQVIDLFEEVQGIEVPVLAIHGTIDDVVPLEDAELLMDALKSKSELAIIEGGDHILIPQAQEVTKLAVDWVVKWL